MPLKSQLGFFKVNSRAFDKSYTTSYQSSIATVSLSCTVSEIVSIVLVSIALSRTIFEIFDVEEYRDFET